MTSDNKNHRRTQCHILFMAILIAVFAVATVVSSCGNKGNLSQSEQEKYNNYRIAIQAAQDSGKEEKSLELSKEFYEVSKKGHSDIFRAYATSAYGSKSVLYGNPDEGKKLLDEALQVASKTSDDTLLMDVYNGLGLYEQVKYMNYYAAGEYYLKSLEHARHCDKRNLFSVLCNLGAILTGVNDTTGLKYIQEAYDIAKEVDSKHYIKLSAMRIAEQMQIRGNKEEVQKWLKIYIENLSPESRMVLENMRKAEFSFFFQKDFAEANRYVDLALSAADTTKNIQISEKADIFSLKAAILYRLGRYEESNKWLEKESDLTNKADNMNRSGIVHQYAMNYEKLGDYAKALEYRKKYIKAVEENANVDRINIMKAKEVALDVAQKNEEIAQQKEHTRMLKWLLWGAAAFIALLTALCLYIYNMYKRQRKLMTVVVERAQKEEKNEEGREKQEKLVDNKYVELFQRIKHEIEDNKMFLDANLSRESLSEHLNINRTYISEAVSQMTGMNFPQYINLLRINEAERRLHDPHVDVSNFANFGRTLGFASLNAFRTAFKQQTGMTLSAYREIARKRPTPALPG